MTNIRGLFMPRLGVLVAGVIALTAALSGGQPVHAVDSGTLAVSPATQDVFEGDTFTVSLMQTATVTTSGAQANLSFDPALLQVVDVAPGSGYPAPDGFTVGIDPQTEADAIIEANTTGVLQNSAVWYATTGGSASVAAGTFEAILVTMRAVNGVGVTAALGLSFPEMLNAAGESMNVTTVDGGVVIQRNHKADANSDGYSAADEITLANCGAGACTGIVTFGTQETRSCKDAGRNCGTPNPPADDNGPTRVAPPPATGYGCSITLDTSPPLTTRKLAQSDVDLDGSVSILDLSRVAGWFGNSINVSPADPRWEGNMDTDSAISILDLSSMASNFGRSVANNCVIQ